MKKIIIPLGALFFSGLINAQLSTTENYVYTKTYLNHPDPSDPSQILKTMEGVQYFDGLGRPKQIINIKSSPTNKDLVITIPYDGFGRPVDSWLPTPMSSLNGGIQSGVDGAAQSYYSDSTPFIHKNFEASPLDRVLSQVQPGSAWQGHAVQFGYEANTNGEVKKYVTTLNPSTFTSSIPVSTTYGAGQLYKNTVIDEDGNKTIEFKNGEGQLILVRKMLNTTESADTYYIYNDYNQLAFVIPPLASVITSLDQTILDNLCYQYKYDGRNRLVEKKLPGKDWEYMVYDKADRLVLTQDGNQRPDHKWSFNKYDKFGRIIYTGIAVDNGDRNAVQGWILFTYGINTEVSGSYTQSGMQIPYGNTAYPQNIESILTVNFYDTYPAGTPAFTPTIPNQSVVLTDNMSSEVNTKSLPLASYIKNIEDNNWTKNYSYYDTRGRVIATHSINHLGGYTKTESKLDFTGIVQQTITRHKRLASNTEKLITETFTYDLQNRLTEHKHQVDGYPAEYLAQNQYNEISQLISKKVGGTSANISLQSIDYSYNIRGWLTKINDPANLNGKLFGYEIKYTSPTYTNLASAKYNGNIVEVDWKNSNDGILKRYSFQYDALNRLNAGFYSEPDAFVPQNGYYNEAMSYDLNGNIMSLQRNMEVQNIGVSQMDNLTYTYTGNRLNTVIDSSYNYSGYPGYGGNLINYDVNGNMIDHADKGILEIKYNHLNLPDYVKFDQYIVRNDPADPFGIGLNVYKNVTYLYRADGVKLKKVHNFFGGRTQADASTTTEYLDGFQYNFDINTFDFSRPQGLQFVPTSEGYYDFAQNKYIYQYKDQVGNIRLSFYKDDVGNTVIDRSADYYPFGLEFGDSFDTFGSITPTYTYSFQEQEKQLETGWNSFKWRNYDPSMGRFFNIDPLSEKYNTWSNYSFSGNRVVDARELEGLEPIITNNTKEKMTVDFYVNVTPKSGMTSQDVNEHLNAVSTILSQNSSLEINMINNPKATFGLDMTKPFQSKKLITDKDGNIAGVQYVRGEARMGDPVNQTITSNGTVKVTAHELTHALGLDHIWDDPSISNTKENINNLQNSDGNIEASMRNNSGTDILPQQVDKMKNTIEIVQPKIKKDEITQ